MSDLLEGFERYNQANWDGDGAEPIKPNTIAVARQFLSVLNPNNMPDVSPGEDGSIGLEWDFDEGPMSSFWMDIGDTISTHIIWRGEE